MASSLLTTQFIGRGKSYIPGISDSLHCEILLYNYSCHPFIKIRAGETPPGVMVVGERFDKESAIIKAQ